MRLFFDDALCEEMVDKEIEVRAWAGDLAPKRDFRIAADAIYRNVPLQKRQVAFLALYQKTFASLPHSARVRTLLDELMPFGALPADFVFLRAFKGEEEGAQLSEGRDKLGIRVRIETFLDEAAFAYFLRHELTHIQDLLDPAFSHDPHSPLAQEALSEETLLRDRYRTLWDLSVDGRLDRRGTLLSGMRERRAAEFLSLFPVLDDGCSAAVIEGLWSGPRPSDPVFRRMVKGAPELCSCLGVPFRPAASPGRPVPRPEGAHCPLCHFTTFEWAVPSLKLSQAVQAEYPGWNPDHGLCTQCANRYLLGAMFASALPSDDRVRADSLIGGLRR